MNVCPHISISARVANGYWWGQFDFVVRDKIGRKFKLAPPPTVAAIYPRWDL
jgi:hypothetical protein